MILGIDPGLKGAIALVERKRLESGSHQLIGVWDMPLREEKTKTHKGNSRSQVDPHLLSSMIDLYKKEIEFAVIEEVGVMTGREGVVGMFRFGQGYGMVCGVLAAFSIPTFFVKPAVWKTLVGLGRDKNESRERILKLFPGKSSFFKRAKDDGRAEAALLAIFGVERFKYGM